MPDQKKRLLKEAHIKQSFQEFKFCLDICLPRIIACWQFSYTLQAVPINPEL